MTKIKSSFIFALLITALFGCSKINGPAAENESLNQPDFANFRNISINEGDTIEAPLVITGEAKGTWFFEGDFPVQIVDNSGKIITQTSATALTDWMTTEFVPFEASIESYLLMDSTPGLVLFIKSNPSDLAENSGQIQIPVTIKPAAKILVDIHFGNQKFDPNTENCTATYSVSREININYPPEAHHQEQALHDTLKQLFLGPSSEEKAQGYVTSLPESLKINSIKIEDGTAKIDFDDSLAQKAAGSCQVGMMRAQIENTILSFPESPTEIQEVKISINGNYEEVLQP